MLVYLLKKKIEFILFGEYNIYGFNDLFNGEFKVEIESDEIVCSYGSKTIRVSKEIIFEPENLLNDYFQFNEIKVGEDFHWEKKEKGKFNGSLFLKIFENKIVVINRIPIDKYLRSVISSEMNDKTPLQALKSHAVVSRSWLISHIQQLNKNNSSKKSNDNIEDEKDKTDHITWMSRQKHNLFDVCSSDHCQRYHGITKLSTGMALLAINETKGVVLTYKDTVCDTRYSKCCGGISESFENVWEDEKRDYLTSIFDYKYEPENYSLDFSNEKCSKKWITGNPQAFCNTKDKNIISNILIDYDQKTNDFYRWEVKSTQSFLAKNIKEKTGINFGEIIDLIQVERGDSGRLIKLKIIGTEKTMIFGKELEIRRILSQTHLYSSAIIIEKENIKDGIPQKFIFKGAGWGHGVGLCQIGAAVMAANGYTFDEILSHYFSSAVLKKIY